MPVNCIDGTVTETVTQNTSSPLVGAGDILLTKDAANRQGEGAYYAFTLDNAYKSQPISVNMTVLGSANYAASDLGVYLYDVTNSTLIYPSNINLAAGTYNYSAFFLASTSTSYRLCIHTQSTNASAYTVQIDNVRVGPQKTLVGFAGTDWQSYTPTFNGFGTTANVAMYWRRVGDHMEISGSFKAGTTTASLGYFTLPNNLTVDTSKIPAIGRGSAGVAILQTSAGSDIGGTGTLASVLYDTTNTGNLYFDNDQAASGSDPFTAKNGSSVLSNSCFVTIPLLRIPISTWTSGVTMADRAVEEYSCNTDDTTSADTTDFSYGTAGCTGILGTTSLSGIGGLAIKKRIRFQTNIQQTDNLFIELQKASGSPWFTVGDLVTSSYNLIDKFHVDVSQSYGIGIDTTSISGTDVDIVFGRYAASAGAASFGANSVAWTSGDLTGAKWRVRKVSSGASIGYPVSSANIVGRVDGVAQSSGYVGEKLTFTARSVSTSSGSWAVNTSALTTLTPGTWIVYPYAIWAGNNSANMIGFVVSTSTSASSGFIGDGQHAAYVNNQNASAANSAQVPGVIQTITVTSNTPIYAQAFAEDSTPSVEVRGFAVRLF